MLQRHDTQVVFHAFDVLAIDDHEVITLPYEQRRELLAKVLEPGSNWTVPSHRIGGGAELLAATAERGLEGVIAKRLGSPYQPGKRTPNWRKVKNRTKVEVVIGGRTGGSGNRSGSFGALLVGRYDDAGVLRFAGGVGTGFSQQTLATLSARFAQLDTTECPFDPVPPREYTRDARWVRPELRALVEIAEFTNEGYVRHAASSTSPPTLLPTLSRRRVVGRLGRAKVGVDRQGVRAAPTKAKAAGVIRFQ